jgi:hypothetical protein
MRKGRRVKKKETGKEEREKSKGEREGDEEREKSKGV